VIEHEVAHLEVQDHSQRFWRLVGARCPGWREWEAWLRSHGHALRL
jgi:predicted metal-dependent hydrolase